MRLLFILRFLCLLAAVAVAAWADSTSDQLIKNVEEHYNHAQTLSVHFVEKYSLMGHPRPPEAGTLRLRKKGKMRWDYSRPEGKLFVSDGKEIYLYTASDNRVEKVPLKDTEDMRAPLAFLLGHLDMKKEFGDFQTRAGDAGTWLDATGKSDHVPYQQIQMLIAPDGSIQKLNVVGRDQSLLSYTFSDEKVNPRLNDDLFHFQIPPGAEVVKAVEYRGQEQ